MNIVCFIMSYASSLKYDKVVSLSSECTESAADKRSCKKVSLRNLTVKGARKSQTRRVISAQMFGKYTIREQTFIFFAVLWTISVWITPQH